jgi:eukaryotic-like serine/threonine-protein kinase
LFLKLGSAIRLMMIGKTIAHYHILEKLGEGGMGVVYKARDTHLDRFVALKILPPERMTDAERKRRFVQEAKAASSLNHPHIVTIYDIDEVDGVHFIAMEYVDGQTLDQRIPRHGMRLNETLKVAVQMADALAAAHAAGIIHRDLKPPNVMVSEGGVAKILDFGLAKLGERTDGSDPDAKTVQAGSDSQTEEGTILGTVSYMSPEQAEGKKVDGRSDIFSFGSVLYEMATGQRAFQGDSKMSTLAAILNKDPKPMRELSETVPYELEKIITHCLRKDRERRSQNVADVKIALEELKEESGSRFPVTTPQLLRRRRWKLVWIIALLLLLTVAVVLVWFSSSPTKEQEVQLTSTPLTSYPGEELYPCFSPDGNQVAFSWNGAKQDNYDIYIKLIGPGEPLRLTTDPAEDYSPAWSPDGRFIAFLRYLSTGRVAVMLVPALGGAERQVAEVSGFPIFLLRLAALRDLTWSPDGKWLALPEDTPAEGLCLLSVETGQKRRLTSPPAQSHDMNPAFAPDGHALAFVRPGSYALLGDIYVLPLSESLTPQEPKRLTFEGMNCNPAWTADGREIVFTSGQVIARRSLWKIMASGSGKPQRLASVGEYGLLPAISRQGHRLAYVRWLTDYNIGRVEIGGRDGTSSPASNFISSTLTDDDPQYSSDGKKIAFHSDRSGSDEIWVCNSDGSNPQQLTFFGGPYTGRPRWSPDGKQIVFDSERDGRPTDIYIISSDGGKPHRLIGDALNLAPSWSRNGKWIYFFSDRSGQLQVWKLPTSGGQAVQVTRKGGYIAFESPDGKFVYYAKDPEVPTSLWKVPVDGGEETRVLDSISHGTNFAVVNKGIYFLPPGRSDTPGVPVQFFSFATGQIKTVSRSTIEKNLWGGLSVSPDGRWVLFTYIDQQGSDLMLVENFR